MQQTKTIMQTRHSLPPTRKDVQLTATDKPYTQLNLLDAQPKKTTTSQQLGSLIKSARDIMRKDKGLNGDLDRLPMLTWIMFLKFLDDIEQIEEQRALLGGKKHR